MLENNEKPNWVSGITKLRNYFLTGFIICAPIAITAYLIWTFIGWVDSWVKPYVPDVYNPDTYLPFSIPGTGLIAAFIFITMVGFLTANFIGKAILSYGERWLDRMPFVRSLYSGLKQIFQTVFAENNASFEQVGLIEYPRPGLFAIVFIATKTKGEVNEKLMAQGQETMSVFLPTTPNPTSGFLLFVPTKDITILDMNVEEAAKLVISAGLVAPEQEEMVKKITEKSKTAKTPSKKTPSKKTPSKKNASTSAK